jgi:anti-sigma28 factor (negative regulator of flagellin synthesis)
MIPSVNSSILRGAYQDQPLKTKDQEKGSQVLNKQGDTSRIDQLKSSIDGGTYRVDIESLARRIAHELT